MPEPVQPRAPRPWAKHRARPKHKRRLDRREPVALAGGVVIVVTIAAFFGIDLDKETAGSIVAAVVAAATWWVRTRVTPAEAVVTQVTADGQVVAGEAAVTATGTPLTVAGDPIRPEVQRVPVNPKLLDPSKA